MVGKWRRDILFVTATLSPVPPTPAACGRSAFGIGQPRRDRRGRTDIVKGRSVRSGGNVLTTLSCSASGIFAICCDLTRPTTTRLARTFQSTRTRRRREQYIPLVAFCLRHFLADFIICMCEFDFRQAQSSNPDQPICGPQRWSLAPGSVLLSQKSHKVPVLLGIILLSALSHPDRREGGSGGSRCRRPVLLSSAGFKLP